MRRCGGITLISLSLLVIIYTTIADARTLTFEDRVAAQKAIELAYRNHLIWPRENASPKLPLSAVLPDEAKMGGLSSIWAGTRAEEGVWTSANSMAHARWAHTATLLPSGKVLVAGGQDGSGTDLTSAELYDPAPPSGVVSLVSWRRQRR